MRAMCHAFSHEVPNNQIRLEIIYIWAAAYRRRESQTLGEHAGQLTPEASE